MSVKFTITNPQKNMQKMQTTMWNTKKGGIQFFILSKEKFQSTPNGTKIEFILKTAP